MIRSSLFLFAILFVAYNVFLAVVRPPIWYQQSIGNLNVAIAEEYVSRPARPDVVVVGSSLAARLDPDALGPRVYNLSLAGDSALTGLDIVLRSRPLPRLVVVEANVLRDLDQKFADARCDVVPLLLSRYLPSSRIKYQPVNVVQNILRGKPRPATHAVDPNALRIGLEVQHSESAAVPDPAAPTARIDALARAIDVLRKANVSVLFVRMPIEPSLVDTPREIFLRDLFDRRFPRNDDAWLPDVPGDFPTVDGVHLSDDATRRFTAALAPAIFRAMR